jgi:hypothetical protein
MSAVDLDVTGSSKAGRGAAGAQAAPDVLKRFNGAGHAALDVGLS